MALLACSRRVMIWLKFEMSVHACGADWNNSHPARGVHEHADEDDDDDDA